MMLTFKKTILLLGMMASAAGVHAGSPDGLNIAVIAGETASQYTSMVKQFVADHEAHRIQCGEYALRLENVYTTKLPRQLTSELALGAARDKTKRKKLSKILTGFRDSTLDRGFDGALTYEIKDGQLRLYGISALNDVQVVVSNLSVNDARDQKKFDIAACKALASLPNTTPP